MFYATLQFNSVVTSIPYRHSICGIIWRKKCLTERRGRNGGGWSRWERREWIVEVRIWYKIDSTRTRREVEIVETPPPFSLPGRDRERWSGPGGQNTASGNASPFCFLLPFCLPRLSGKSFHNLHSEFEREGTRHRNGQRTKNSERNCACLCVCAVESMPAWACAFYTSRMTGAESI